MDDEYLAHHSKIMPIENMNLIYFLKLKNKNKLAKNALSHVSLETVRLSRKAYRERVYRRYYHLVLKNVDKVNEIAFCTDRQACHPYRPIKLVVELLRYFLNIFSILLPLMNITFTSLSNASQECYIN